MRDELLTKVDPAALHMMWLMANAGFDTRLCGGAVRDLLAGKTPKDWDLATVALPEQVVEVMNSHGLTVLPTGLQHGTVTVMFQGEPFEFTTLRVDEETDGRHAKVSFTEDWQLDASRRDFTMNAMFLDSDGVLHDFFGGQADLEQGVVRFVGDPRRRMEEDYLRILRFFRFFARLHDSLDSAKNVKLATMSTETAKALRECADGLQQVSGERVWSELKKVMDCRHSAPHALTLMNELGVMDVLGMKFTTTQAMRFGGAVRLFNSTRCTENHGVLLAVLLKNEDVDVVSLLKNRLRASRNEVKPVEFALAHRDLDPTRINAFDLLADNDVEMVAEWLAWHGDSVEPSSGEGGRLPKYRLKPVQELVQEVRELTKPKFPVTGEDLQQLGVPKGPEMGKVMRQLRKEWARSEFVLPREFLVNSVYWKGAVFDE